MEIYNENEKYALHFIFQTNILHIKSSSIPLVENNVNITYQFLGRQMFTQNIIHENSSRSIYLSIYIFFDYLIK